MKHRITRDDLLPQAHIIELLPSRMITAAAIAQGLMALADASDAPEDMGGTDLKERIGTSGDRWYGGCLMVALAMAEVVDELCQFDGGVFTYEFVEVCDPKHTEKGGNLSCWLMEAIDPLAWFHICDNRRSPGKEALTAVFREWAEQADVPVK